MPSKAPLPGSPASFWHTIPLHYVPYLLHTGELYAQTRLAALRLPIVPRPTAARRDRKLHLDRFVHFSFAPHTPLLADKHQKGYPHVLTEWDAKLADTDGAAFVRFNAKSWQHRDAFAPITDADEKAVFLRERQETGRFPSAELLIPDAVPLVPHGIGFHTENQGIADWMSKVGEALRHTSASALSVAVSPALFPCPCAAFDGEPFHAYARSCASWSVLAKALGNAAPPFPAPPDLPFD